MAETQTENRKPAESIQETLEQVRAILQQQDLVEALAQTNESPPRGPAEPRVRPQHIAQLQSKLEKLHPADIASILEQLPLDERLAVWNLVKAEQDGDILLEVSDAVRETLIEDMDADELLAATEQLDTDEIADLAPDLPQEVIADVFRSLSVEERDQLRAALSYPEETVGAIMDFDMVEVREDVSLEVVLRYLRRLDDLPDHTDQIFVVDRGESLKGVLPINRLIVSEPETLVSNVMSTDFITFEPQDRQAYSTCTRSVSLITLRYSELASRWLLRRSWIRPSRKCRVGA